MAETNHRITLAQRPVGPVGPECFAADDVPVPTPGPGEVLVEVGWLSIDPTIRGWMSQDTYLPAIAFGEPIRSGGIGTVIESNNDDIPVGATMFGMTGWQQYAVMDGTSTVLPDGVEPEAALSVFGVTGLTAYFGLLEIGQPQAGDTVLVSGAAGATGSVVGQIAKIKGCRVVGIAGTDEKCAMLTDEFGFDAAIRRVTVGLPADAEHGAGNSRTRGLWKGCHQPDHRGLASRTGRSGDQPTLDPGAATVLVRTGTVTREIGVARIAGHSGVVVDVRCVVHTIIRVQHHHTVRIGPGKRRARQSPAQNSYAQETEHQSLHRSPSLRGPSRTQKRFRAAEWIRFLPLE